MKVAELKGIESYRALNVFHKLMLGLKMLPSYFHLPYADFYEGIAAGTDESKEKIIREAALFVDLEPGEIETLACFCFDTNGVRYGKPSLKHLGPDQIFEIIVSVCVEISKITIDFVTEPEKKNLKTSA